MAEPAESLVLIDTPIAGAVTGVISGPFGIKLGNNAGLILHATFLYGSGGTTAKAWVQTSFDGGVTWVDIATFAFLLAAKTRMGVLTTVAVTTLATPTDGSLADDTVVNGFLGHMYRVKLTTTGTYAGATSLKIVAMPK